MKVFDQLESAQLELITGNPAVLPTGRAWIDITTANKGIPKIYDGSNVRPLLMGQTTPIVSQNSGQACTVDWSTGLYQQVILTNNAIISFVNPQSGQEHVLYVTQRAQESGTGYNAPFMYQLNMIDQASGRQPYQPMTCPQSSESHYYRWFYSPGIKPAYADIPFLNPGPYNSLGTGGSIDVSKDGKYLTKSIPGTSPYQGVYPLIDGGDSLWFGGSGIVTPQTPAAAVSPIRYSPDGNFVFVGSGTTPFLQGYVTDRGTSFLALSNPATLPTGTVLCIEVHPTGGAVVVGEGATPFFQAYPINAGGYGTKYANPATLAATTPNAMAWHPCGNYLVACQNTNSPFLQCWPFDLVNGFGAILTAPSTIPLSGPSSTAGQHQVAFRPQGDYIAMQMGANGLYIVSFNAVTGAFGGTVNTSAFSGTATSVAWTPDGQYLIVGLSASPFFAIYDFSNQTIGAPITLDVSNPGSAVNDIVVHPSGEYVFFTCTSTAFKVYNLPRKVRNYLRLTRQGP